MRRSILLSLFLGVSALLPAPEQAFATSVVTLTDAELVQFSDVIAHVTILSVEPFRFDENIILTRITAQVNECLKSCSGDTIVFYARGGRLDDATQVFHGEFKPEAGAELVVFLEKIRRYGDKLMVLGLEQGAFRVLPIPQSRTNMCLSNAVIRHTNSRDSAFDASQNVHALKAAIRSEMEHAR